MTDLDEYMKKVSKEVRKKLSRYAPVSVDPKGVGLGRDCGMLWYSLSKSLSHRMT